LSGFSQNIPAQDLAVWDNVRIEVSKAKGIGKEDGTCRRDPSDVIKLGERYYVFYTKLSNSSPIYAEGYYGTVWYAVSEDEGFTWREKGIAVGKGEKGDFDSFGVFTPNVVKGYDGKFYIYYTGVGDNFDNKRDDYSPYNRTAIGVARIELDDTGEITSVEKLKNGNPVLLTSDDNDKFDSFRVDDAAIVLRDGKYWLYYKGRAHQKTPRQTKMGLAIADHPEGPYTRQNNGNPVQTEGHEVLVWARKDGVVSLVSNVGNGLYYSSNGIDFTKVVNKLNFKLRAPGAFRQELTEPSKAAAVSWGIHMGAYGTDPFLERYEFKMPSTDNLKKPATIMPKRSYEDRSLAAGWGQGKNWMNQHEDINQIVQKTPKTDLIFLGNSITQNIGGPGRKVGSPASEIWEEYFGSWTYLNMGISGDRTQNILWRIDNGNLDGLKPRFIVLMIGTNNIVDDTADDIALGIKTIVKRINTKTPDTKILLMSIIRGESNSDLLRQKANQVNRIISKLDVDRNVTYVDLSGIFYNPDGSPVYNLLRTDHVHFTEEGYRAWAKVLQPYLD